ncbi:helix-turn-helix domain-containing protein [Pseudarthrobacter sp. H2]|uniref:helix-turn-helix domain-containing protein n=1 Tax=Pseudarthrobacter sp. H2 TaxID=3418415 RepID=UPI003CF4F13F
MAERPEEIAAMPTPAAAPRFSKMLTLAEVQEILNVGMPTIYGLLSSGDLRGVQLGGRRMWRVSEDDLAAYLERAYTETQDRITAGTMDAEPAEDGD